LIAVNAAAWGGMINGSGLLLLVLDRDYIDVHLLLKVRIWETG
jgi:hypothetical protein